MRSCHPCYSELECENDHVVQDRRSGKPAHPVDTQRNTGSPWAGDGARAGNSPLSADGGAQSGAAVDDVGGVAPETVPQAINRAVERMRSEMQLQEVRDPQFRIHSVLGRGGFGTVYRGVSAQQHATHGLVIMHQSCVASGDRKLVLEPGISSRCGNSALVQAFIGCLASRIVIHASSTPRLILTMPGLAKSNGCC